MNTSYTHHNQYQLSHPNGFHFQNRISRQPRVPRQSRVPRQYRQPQNRFQAFIPSNNNGSAPGIYNRNQLMQAVRGNHSCCGCSGPSQIQRPTPQQRNERLNNRLTDVFNQLGNRFPRGNNAVGRLAGDKDRSTLVDLLGKNDLVGAVQGLEKQGPVTILAPSNKAFADLAKKDPALFAKLTDPRNKKALQDVLKYHVQAGRTDFQQGGTFDSLLPNDGAKFFGNPFRGTIQNGNQTIRTGVSSVSANGSVVIPVDQVLIPPGFDPSKLV